MLSQEKDKKYVSNKKPLLWNKAEVACNNRTKMTQNKVS